MTVCDCDRELLEVIVSYHRDGLTALECAEELHTTQHAIECRRWRLTCAGLVFGRGLVATGRHRAEIRAEAGRRWRVLQYVERTNEHAGRAPSVADVGRHFGLTHSRIDWTARTLRRMRACTPGGWLWPTPAGITLASRR